MSAPDDSEAKPTRTHLLLENLPAEIRRHLLFTLEYEELKALVHASPVYHQQYLLDRHSVLSNCLQMVLGSNTIDAFIKPLAWHYTEWALDNIAKETKEETKETGDEQAHKPLSRTEEAGIVRALYRFQLHCNLFGVSQYNFFRQRRLKFLDVDILNIFFRVFEPWDVEEIACIYTFTKAKYNQIFDDIRWDVHQENPKFEAQRRPPTPDGAFDFDSEMTRSMLLEGTITRGLELLHYVHFETKDHAHLYMRRKYHPSDKDLKQRRCDPLPFQSDREDLPPLAWTLIWQGTYSNLLGWYIEDASRVWGYIMWGAARLEHTGAKDLLARQ
ncbi:hypothetical protein SI65_05969 [Aspergillus cristatus]|uniref:F-box domain-containing protein n=1 Tax=Aspergillus cristatus TaxID=573508 RepID=A0A1E3BEY8_ASPCR|nr:hypothetical protein SI65_05969 [Aspergillus cristatus]